MKASGWPHRENEWSEWQDLNLRPLRPERSALPDCATLRHGQQGRNPVSAATYSRLRGAPQARKRSAHPIGHFSFAPCLVLCQTAFPAIDGASPSGKAADFDSAMRRFESSRPSQPVSRKPICAVRKPEPRFYGENRSCFGGGYAETRQCCVCGANFPDCLYSRFLRIRKVRRESQRTSPQTI